MTQSQYHLLYYCIAVVAILLLSLHKRFNKTLNGLLPPLVIASISLLVGSRPENVGTDTEIYVYWIQSTLNNPRFDIQNFGLDPVFSLVLYCLGIFGNVSISLFGISLITNLVTYYFCKRISPNALFPARLMFLTIMASFSYFSQQINVIRIGFAMGVALMFTLSLLNNKKAQTIIWGIVALFSHFSTIFILAPAVLVQKTNIKIKYYLIAYAAAVAFSAVGYGILDTGILALIAFSKVDLYTQGTTNGYEVGFRPAFVLFNTFFLFLFLYLRRNADYRTDYYLKIYIITSIIFFLWFALPFSDRIGAFSWNILPILLSIFLCNRYKRSSLKATSFVLLYAFICFMI